MQKGRDIKPHIGIFGRRNNGKSSIINALTGQEVAIVSDIAGTTTDVVKKSIEIPNVGASVLIDTAGIDDAGELGNKRVAKTREVLKIIDLAILIVAENIFDDFEKELISEFQKYEIPWFAVHNKSDIKNMNNETKNIFKKYDTEIIEFNNVTNENFNLLLLKIQNTIPESAFKMKTYIGDIIKKGDTVILITPIDIEAPEGRMILPQVQLIRDVLDNDAINLVIKEDIIEEYIQKMNPKPSLVITDSQAFEKVNKAIPKEIPLTSFSIVLSRQKGNFEKFLEGTPKIDELKNNDKILILESCTHQVTCDDIGRVKIPRWLKEYTKKEFQYDFISGLDKIENIEQYALIIQCGGCMVTRKQLMNRLKGAIDANIPVSNYGMTIAFCLGIFDRVVEPFMKLIK